MNKLQKTKCHTIIHAAASSAAVIGAGLAQLPTSDTVPLMGIQTTMVIAVAKVFGKSITQEAAKATATSMAAGYVGRGVSQVVLGWLPGLGNVVNASTAFALTEFVGWAAAKHFEKKSIWNLFST